MSKLLFPGIQRGKPSHKTVPVINAGIVEGLPPALTANKAGNLTLSKSVASGGGNWCTRSSSRFIQLSKPILAVTDAGAAASLEVSYNAGTNYGNKNINSDSQATGTHLIYNNGLSHKTMNLPAGTNAKSAYNNEVWAVVNAEKAICKSTDYGDNFVKAAVVDDADFSCGYDFLFCADGTHLVIASAARNSVFVIDKNLTYARKVNIPAGNLVLYAFGVYPDYSLCLGTMNTLLTTRNGGLGYYQHEVNTDGATAYWDYHYNPPNIILSKGANIVAVSVNGGRTFADKTLSYNYDGVYIAGNTVGFSRKSNYLDIYSFT
jgi:hypothetical protein